MIERDNQLRLLISKDKTENGRKVFTIFNNEVSILLSFTYSAQGGTQ